MVEEMNHMNVGVIPIDWEILVIGNEFIFKNGLNKEKQYFGYGTPIVNYMDVYRLSGIKQNDIRGRVYLNQQEIKNYQVQKGDVLFTRTSETVEEIGISSVILEDLKDTVFSGFVLRGRPKSKLLDVEFCRFCFSSAIVRKQILTTASYTTRALTNGRLLSEIKLPLPPTKAEQTAIATALNDVDVLINQLNQLITKKCNIKTGAMQELLKPKDGWKVKKLGEICNKITTGKLDANAMKPDGEYRFYTCAKDFYFIDKFAFDDEALLISGNGENVGYVHYYKGKFNAYQRTYVLAGFSLNIQFVKKYLDKYLASRIEVEVNTGNTPYIRMGTLSEMDIYFPKTETEQTHIAQILSDMDNEIQELESKLEKYKLLKQGMIQSLLTGKIRLV